MYQVVRYRRALSRGGGYGWRSRAWAWMVWAARAIEARLSLLKTAGTFTSFTAACCIMPLLLVIFAWMKCWRAAVGAWVKRSVEGVEGLVQVGHSPLSTHNRTHTHIHTLLLCLAGNPSLEHIRERIKIEVVDRVDSEGQPVHPNFKRRVGSVGGYPVWLWHNFDISDHVTQAPLHHRGRLVTHRNIQECVSEVVSQPLPLDLPPWQVTIIPAWEGGGCEAATWVVARAHHTLAAELTLPDILATAHPDPWRHPAARGLTLLSAPAATTHLVHTVKTGVTKVALEASTAGNAWWQERGRQLVAPLYTLMEEATQTALKATPKSLPPPATTLMAVVVGMSLAWHRLHQAAISLWAYVTPYLRLSSLWKCFVWCVVKVMWLGWRCVVVGVVWPWWAWKVGKAVWESPELKLVLKAVVEVYWVVRALVSLPRLVLIEVISAWGVMPLTGWVGRRGSVTRRSGVTVAWSDPVPLSTARGVRGVTGATLSEVLLTASAGAVRDYLRVTGLTVPDKVRCSLSVHSRRYAQNRPTTTPGFVMLPLPTGAANATSALRQLRHAMESIRRYPERYLASTWLLHNVVHFLPQVLLGPVFGALAATCPVLLSNLAGPPRPEQLWGHQLLDIFYWRPPHHGAAVSVCVTSYRGQAVLGVTGDVRVVPGAATLPQAFVTHLNELAVESGVRLERPSPRPCWFRNGSPGSSPAPTPPPTPTLGHKHPSAPTFHFQPTLSPLPSPPVQQKTSEVFTYYTPVNRQISAHNISTSKPTSTQPYTSTYTPIQRKISAHNISTSTYTPTYPYIPTSPTYMPVQRRISAHNISTYTPTQRKISAHNLSTYIPTSTHTQGNTSTPIQRKISAHNLSTYIPTSTHTQENTSTSNSLIQTNTLISTQLKASTNTPTEEEKYPPTSTSGNKPTCTHSTPTYPLKRPQWLSLAPVST